MLWSRKAPPAVVHDRSRLVGIDLNATRARGVSVSGGKTRPMHLDGTGEELQLVVNLDRRPQEVGRVGAAVVRRLPHAACAGYLASLGQPRSWGVARQALTADGAVALTLEKIRGPVVAESEGAVLALPAYLSPPQVAKLVELAGKAKLPLYGTTFAALAVAAQRADAVLGQEPATNAPDDDGGRPDWVVPIRPQDAGPGAVVVVDADEHALTAAVVGVEPGEVRQLGIGVWPKFARKAWMDRLLDAVSDRCVRTCRRDPRDSGDAEQALYDQFPDALDLSARGHAVVLNLRSAHWYQDLPHRPADFEGYCTVLAKPAADSVRDLIGSLSLPVPPRAVWLTATAARLPGLAASIYKESPERTAVEALPDAAIAEAAAALAARWKAGSLPRAHLDMVMPREQDRGVRIEDRAEEVPYARRVPRS